MPVLPSQALVHALQAPALEPASQMPVPVQALVPTLQAPVPASQMLLPALQARAWAPRPEKEAQDLGFMLWGEKGFGHGSHSLKV